jgi:predicted RNA-binding Zn-ribbon protein involved in translation (DUF1610 family)
MAVTAFIVQREDEMNTETIHGDFCIQMTCPNCGGDLELLTERRLTAREHSSVWFCAHCRATWSIKIDIVEVAATKSSSCGTNYGYARHLDKAETTCEECRKAHAQFVAERKRVKVSA